MIHVTPMGMSVQKLAQVTATHAPQFEHCAGAVGPMIWRRQNEIVG